MYTLIKAQMASKYELEDYYTLDEALKLYALWKMDQDIQRFEHEELKAQTRK